MKLPHHGLCLLLLILPVVCQAAPHTNIEVIMADDLGWRDRHGCGNELVDTPHLDQLTREGMKFTDACAVAPVCSPTRAVMLQPLAGRGHAAGVETPNIPIGLVGAGGRGAWIAGLFPEHGGYLVHAVADYFQAVAEKAGDALGVDQPRCFSVFKAGAVRHIATFHQPVTGGIFTNETVRRPVDGCLACILGRDAAARGGELTIKQLLNENRKLLPDLKGLKA